MTMTAVQIGLYAALGLALGAAYFALMWRTVRLHVDGAPAGRIALQYALRLGLAGVVLWRVALMGAGPLLASAAGFVVARLVATRFVRRDR